MSTASDVTLPSQLSYGTRGKSDMGDEDGNIMGGQQHFSSDDEMRGEMSGYLNAKVWVWGFNAHTANNWNSARRKSIIALTDWLLDNGSIPELKLLAECLQDTKVHLILF